MKCNYFLASMVIVACSATQSFARTEKNSFLNTPANSVAELIAQIKKDPQVRDRYMRHFGTSVDKMVAEFSRLHLGRLPAAGSYLVYNIDDKGIVHSKMLHLKAGTAVFMDSTGKPVLKKSCGNAMKRGTDGQDAVVQLIPGKPADLRDIPIVADAEPFPLASTELPPQIATVDAGEAEIPVLTTPPTPPAVPVSGSGASFGFPALLVVAGGSLSLGSGGHPHSAVPEPASMTVLGLGLAYAAIRKRRSRA